MIIAVFAHCMPSEITFVIALHTVRFSVSKCHISVIKNIESKIGILFTKYKNKPDNDEVHCSIFEVSHSNPNYLVFLRKDPEIGQPTSAVNTETHRHMV